MGNVFGSADCEADRATSEGSSGAVAPPADDYPYLWAIRSPEVLDWKKTVSSDDTINQMAASQAQLPVRIGTREATGIYLGDAKCARDVGRLRALRIGAIINVAGPASHNRDMDDEYTRHGINIVRLHAEDEVEFPMLRLNLDTVREHIERWRAAAGENGCRVLIHCTAGINRSGVLVAALLMEYEQHLTVLEAVRHIRSRRGNCFLWNEGFQEQLVAHARMLGQLGEPLDGTPKVFPSDMFIKAERQDVRALFQF
jgi:protein-tyrosine phosphatase